MDSIESILLSDEVSYKRTPYSAYTEQLSVPIRENIEDLKIQGDVFYMVMKNNTYINLFKQSRPAALTGEDAIKVAIRHLQNERVKEFLVQLESDTLKNAVVEYLGDYSDMATMGTEPRVPKTSIIPDVSDDIPQIDEEDDVVAIDPVNDPKRESLPEENKGLQ